MLAEPGWFSENMEMAREIGRDAAVSSTIFIDLTTEDVTPLNPIWDFQPWHSQPGQAGSEQVKTEQVESSRFEPRQFQAMGQEEVALENRVDSQYGEESSERFTEERTQQRFGKEHRVEMAEECRNVEPVTVIDLDTDDEVEEPSSDMSMALVVVPDPEPEPEPGELQAHNAELAVVRVDNAETRETTSQSSGSPPTTANELIVARQCSPGNGHLQQTQNEAGEWVHPPRWSTTTVGILSVQCARCRKWRVVPDREKYEEIREHILETPWVCEHGSEWRPGAHCGHPADLEQDSGSLWALDKPNLPSSPPGWSRKVVVRRDCSTRFADVYYISPEGKTLRSTVEVARYLEEKPSSVPPGTRLSQFSFTSPQPLPGVWVAKRRTRSKALIAHSSSQECKKAKTAEPLAKRLAHKLLHSSTHPPSLPVAPSFPQSLNASQPRLMPRAPCLGPDLVQPLAMQAHNYLPPDPNFSCNQNLPSFTCALPLRQCSPPRSGPSQQASYTFPDQRCPISDAASSHMFGPALAALRMKQYQQHQQQQQQKSRLRGAIPISQSAILPGNSLLREPNGGDA